MRNLSNILTCTAALILGACDRSPPAKTETHDAPKPAASAPAAPTAAAAPTPSASPAPSADDELEQLKSVTPVDACAWLPLDKLKPVFPEQKFEVHQKVDPRMSGYVWDSRCTYWAGVGTIEYAKDTPTHTVEIFVATTVSPAKAQANLASRQETATSTKGYQAQAALGANAYSTTDTGVARLFFVKGQSEVQINISDLKSPNEEKVKRALALAQSL